MDLPFYTNHVYEPLQLTPDQLADVTSAGDEERHVLRTRPYEDGPGEEYAEEVIGAFHQSIKPPSLIESLIGDPQDPPEFTYEMWFDDGKIKFIWTVPDDYWYEELRRVITGEYPKIGIERMGKDHPTFNDDDYIAGGYLDQTNYKYIPIKGLSNVGAFEEDKAPLRLITSEVAGQQDTSALVQVHFEPAPTNWRESDGLLKPGVDRVRTYYEQGNYKHSYINPKLEDPTEQDLRIARVIADHEGDPAYYVTIRFFVFAPTKEIAQNHASSIGNVYRATYHNKELNQRLEHHPLTGDDLVDELVDAANRDPGAEERPMTVPELAALAHVPNGDVDTPNIDWTSKGLGSQAPSEAARKPETIDPRPYEQFGPEANANDALVPSASPLPPAEAENVEPDADATTGAESADESSPKEFTTEQRPGTAQFGQPREQIAAEKQSDFDTIVREVESANLTFDEIRARYDSNEEVENLINLIKKELEWRKSAPEDEETEDTEADTDTESTPARQVAPHGVKSPPNSPHNLPVVEGDYDDYGFTPAESRREWMLDPHTGEDRAYEIRVRKENPNGDDDWYMGRDVRNELFDSHRDHPDSPIWLGWLKDNRVGVREIGIEPNAWFRHFTVFGMTGMGKSTFQNNIMIQIAQKGYGFCYIDPKGDAVDELIEQLPEDRLDDVIWIEPGSTDHDKVVGINFLEPAYDKDHPNFDREVTSIVDDLTAILKGGDYWGPKMEGITTNIARAMIRSDINYTLLDMYYVLLSEDARQSFADMVKQEGKEKRQEGKEDEFVEDMENIHTYTQQIANMDYDEVDAVVRRIQHWVEDPIARGIVAHREGTVNITDAVEEGKIILVNINIDSEDIKEVVSTAIMRRVWAAIKARDEDEHDRTPFFSFIDEFDDVAAPEMDIEKMLSKARSGKMGVGLACQNPSQIPEAPRKQMFANARTLNTFGVGEPEDAGLISTRFGEEVERNQIMNIPQFTVYTRILLNTEDGPQLSDPMPINTFADYPPVRDHEDRHEVIEESLEKHGVKPLEETLEESQMVLFDMGNNITVQRALLQSIWEVRINRDTEYVALEAVDEAFEKRTGRSILDYPEGVTIDPEWAEIYHPENEQASLEEFQQAGTAGSDTASPTERLSDGGYTQAEADGTGEIVISSLDGGARVTEAGQQEVLSSDRYRARPTDTHRELLSRGVFEWFTRAGFTVNILEQSGSHSHPDAEGILPVESDTDSLAVAQESWETLKREFPMLAELSNGREVTFEAEVSLRKPAGPLQNTARAIHNNRRPIFIVPDGRREDLMPDDVSERSMDYWAKRLNSILTDPTMVRRFNVHEDENGNRRTSRVLYNTQDHLSLSDDPSEEKFPLIRKGSQCVWEEHDGQVLILYDGEGEDGKQRGKITPEDLDNASANAFDTWCRYDKYEDEYVVYPSNSGNIMYDDKESLKEDWQRVYKPFHPDSEIKGNPDDVDPLITILREPEYIDSIGDSMPVIFYPDGKNDRGSDPEMRPLIPEEHQQVWDHDLIPGYNPIEDTPEFLEDGEEASFRERIYNANESKQIMADKIDTSKEIGSTDIPETDYDPHYEPDHDFGGKSPTSRAFWEKVWDNTDTDLESPLEVEPLRDGLTGAAMPPDIHEKAINAGVESGHLIPSDIGLFLARPHQRPKVILDDYERYDNRNIWADVWRQNGREEDRHIPRRVLQISALDVGPFTGERGDKQTVTAAIEIALKRGALQTTEDNKIKLPPAGIPKKWKRVWDEYGADTDEAIDREFLEMTLRGIERLDSIEDAENKVQDAIHKNTLYETDNGIRINDPQSDEGPPLDSDDEDDDGDGAGSANDTDGGGGGGDADREDAETSTQDTGGEDSPDGDSGQADEADGTEAESGSETTLSGTPATDSDDTAGDNVTGPLDDRSDIDLDEGSGEVTEASADATDQTGDGEKPADGGADSTAADRTADEVGEDGGVGATLQTGDETAPDDYEGAEQWAITPTEQAPDEWKDAFAAAMDAYHDHLDTQIDENTWWNELVDAHRDQHHAAAAEDCLQHDHYVARCSSCVITADCDGCTHETETRPVARVEWTSCKDHDAIPKADCSDCSEVLYCHECSTDNADVDVDPTAPLEYVERVTCWNCEAFEEHSDVEGEPCSCETHTHEGPLHRLPETARDYFTGPDWSRDDTFSGTDLADQHTPHRHAGEAPDTIGRNWSNEIVEDRQLGWVPGTKPYEQPVANQLLEDDYTVAQLLATGLFDVDVRDISAVYSDDDDRSEYDVDNITDFDLEADIDDESHPLTAEDIIRPAWSGRPIFPAFNETGEPVYAYARQQKGRRHPNDYRENAKYLKLSIDDAYVYAREPIYGCDTLEEGTPTVITEGVADAITAHQHGLPCLSPVTTQFKDKHHEPLLDLLEAHDIDTILMIQDNEPGSFDPLAEDDYDHDDVEADIAGRKRWLLSDSQDLTEHIEEHDGPGPIGKAMEIDGVGPGLTGALTTASFLEDNGITAIQVDLPRFGGQKVDLDDYLSSGLHEYAPPLPAVQTLRRDLDTDEEAALLDQLVESAAFTHYYEDAVMDQCTDDEGDSIEADVLDAFATKLDAPPADDRSDLEWACLVYAARERMRNGILPSRADDATDWDVEAVQNVDGPETFDKNVVGILLGLGNPVAAVSDLTAAPRTPSFPVGEKPTASVDAGAAESAASPDESPASGRTATRFTPLFSGPAMYAPADHPKYEAAITQQALAELEQYDTDDADPAAAEDAGGDSGSVRRRNQLYDLSLRQVAGKKSGFRGKNPLGHVGESTNYFVMLTDDVAYDHKRKATFNALTYVAVDAGVRDITSPSGQFDHAEILETWVYAKQQGYIGSNARVPNRALNEAAVQMGVADYSDIGPREVGSGEDAFTISETLPADQYNEAIEAFEDHYDVDPGRSKITAESKFENSNVTQENSLELFGELFLDEDPDRGDNPRFDEPRVSSNVCWQAYEKWCEINEISPKNNQFIREMIQNMDARKNRGLVEIGDEEKNIAAFFGVHLTDDGWWLWRQTEE
jgi:hypothetical protein